MDSSLDPVEQPAKMVAAAVAAAAFKNAPREMTTMSGAPCKRLNEYEERVCLGMPNSSTRLAAVRVFGQIFMTKLIIFLLTTCHQPDPASKRPYHSRF